MLAAAFDLISFLGQQQESARDFYRAATFTFVGGAIVSVPTALTGFWDWLKSTEKGTQARRTVNAHAWTMVAVTVLVLVTSPCAGSRTRAAPRLRAACWS